MFELYHYCIQWAIYPLGSRNVNVVRAMPQAVSGRPVPAESRVRTQFSPCGIRGGRLGIATRFSPSPSVFPLPVSFHQLILILILSEGQAGDVWGTPPRSYVFFFGNQESVGRNSFHRQIQNMAITCLFSCLQSCIEVSRTLPATSDSMKCGL